MKTTSSFKKRMSEVFRLWDEREYEQALSKVEALLREWPGNPQLYVAWANLVQLQERPTHSLDEAKKALQQAVDLDRNAPEASIELGHFLDSVEDDPEAATKAFGNAIATARRLLRESLIGQAKALLQLNKNGEALNCLVEYLYLSRFDTSLRKKKPEEAGIDFLLRDSAGGLLAIQVKDDPHADEVEELFKQALVQRSA